jgi:hypothetical protein
LKNNQGGSIIARKGKETEKIVQSIEQLLLSDDFKEITEIISPDYLLNHLTGTKQEVDISIKININSHPILIVIECRDWASKQSSTWIQQLVTKKANLHIDKMIALSTSGFSSPAIKLAKAEGIETRILQKFDPFELLELIKKEPMTYIETKIELINVDLILFKKDIHKKIPNGNYNVNELIMVEESFSEMEKIFISKKNNKEYSMFDIIVKYLESKNLISMTDKLSEPLIEDIKISFKDPNNTLLLKTKYGLAKVLYLKAQTSISNKIEKLPLKKVIKYMRENVTLAERFEYGKTQVDGKSIKFIIQRNIIAAKKNLSIQTEN